MRMRYTLPLPQQGGRVMGTETEVIGLDDVLHVYGSQGPHDDVVIVGAPRALWRLRDALDFALDGVSVRMEVMATDGEGYDVWIAAAPTLNNLPLPYGDAPIRGIPPATEEEWDALRALFSASNRATLTRNKR